MMHLGQKLAHTNCYVSLVVLLISIQAYNVLLQGQSKTVQILVLSLTTHKITSYMKQGNSLQHSYLPYIHSLSRRLRSWRLGTLFYLLLYLQHLPLLLSTWLEIKTLEEQMNTFIHTYTHRGGNKNFFQMTILMSGNEALVVTDLIRDFQRGSLLNFLWCSVRWF